MNALVPTQPSDLAEPEPNFDGLTTLQSAFVRCYVANGDGNATKAARDAGYSNSSAHAVGYRLLRMQPVVDAIQRHTAMQIGPLAPQALRTMAALLSAKSEFVRQTAAADLLDRAGFKPPERHKLSVTGGVTIDIKLTD